MSVEFIGYVSAQEQTEVVGPNGPVVDPEYIASSALLQERGGFDRALIAFHSSSPDSLVVAQHAASATTRLGLLIAHRPGFAAPTLAARQFATLDQLTGGRVAMHVITGGNDRELQADGDHLTKAERYSRAAEYIQIVRQEWQENAPFDHGGDYYQVRGAHSDVRPVSAAGIPIYFGGASEEAIAVTGKYADGYALWGEPLKEAGELVGRVKDAAAQNGRKIRFSVSFRPIIEKTEELAWERAAAIQALLEKRQEEEKGPTGIGLDRAGQRPTVENLPTNEGSKRLQKIAARSNRHDERLWTGVAQATGGRWNSTSLVGTADQVAESLLRYYRIGIETFLIRGFDPLSDALTYGSELIPRVKALVEREERCGR
ncbi:alkanesulfonate monooxygenase [Acetobacter aceti NRIC 0242]|uniref:Alkanesulfonate monooxygenase n=1 Tax=Acetobacter aceti NBRC 14818 TaxID=887700 RepID=A0AB33IAV4_ACEAC|nr:LLM class flavin-dependent oxidoreductase [Acetobacter aceti]TCS34270.1 alkanesulfonate monooxygenase [Acetobacter aceti NBRC 14818]BCK75445.1 alkanesulfonate monooxygenase [Acetobacter aceti NBRC 14818]GAN58698.1 alkanesulfonate monooxygenase [Acetobacter aceti NBRC 14818]GBO81353.1 alkanesulfonate monooxygenase [Acetobacter aceti NRIC 0242]